MAAALGSRFGALAAGSGLIGAKFGAPKVAMAWGADDGDGGRRWTRGPMLISGTRLALASARWLRRRRECGGGSVEEQRWWPCAVNRRDGVGGCAGCAALAPWWRGP
jgi:hypothetical protein